MSDEQSFNEDDIKKTKTSSATKESSSETNDDTKKILSSIDEDLKSKKELRKRLNLFYLISIGNATGQSFLFNFFSAFAVLVGVTSSMLGFITSIRNLMSSLFQGVIGRLSDKYGRRYFLLIGFFLVFSSLVILVFISSPIMLIIISIIQAFSLSLIIPVWNATLGDVTKIDERATYIGKLSAIGTAISVSLMLGLAILFYLLDDVFVTLTLPSWYEERIKYSFAFMLAAFNFLLCILGAFLLRETCCVKEKKEQQPSMFLALKNPDFKKFFIINSIFGLIMASMWPIFPIAQVTVLEMNFAQIAIINAIFSTSSSLAQFFGGKLGDRIGRKPLLIFSRMSMFVIPVVMIGAILIDNWLLLIISNIIGGAGIGALNVSLNAYILDLAPIDQMGAYSGLTQVGWGITTFIGSLSAGFIADAIETSIGTRQMVIITFIAISILRLLASIGFFFIKESFPQKAREELQEKRNAEKISKYPPVLASCEDSSTQTK